MNTGGPVFPTEYFYDQDTTVERMPTEGMALRDYFAAKAMQAILSRSDSRFTTTLEFVGAKSYQYADAMLKAWEQ